jgi:hypothetical protein
MLAKHQTYSVDFWNDSVMTDIQQKGKATTSTPCA